MIELVNATKKFNRGTANEFTALNNINLKIADGEFAVLIGANGSGKSSLLNAVAGSLILDSGEIYIDAEKVNTWKDFERSKYISRIFQNPLSGTAPDLSILDNFRLAALRTQPKLLKRGINEAFRETVKSKISFLGMGLENKLDQAMGLLSGGQRQALTLLMAVMDTTKIILLDEPTAALDPKSSELVIEKARELVSAYKLSAILVTHEIKYAQRYGSRVIQLAEGAIIRDKSGAEKQALSVSELFEWFA